MNYINTSVNPDNNNVVSQADIGKIKFTFFPHLQDLICCKSNTSDGCQITLWDDSKIVMCNNCLYTFFDELLMSLEKYNFNIYEIKLAHRCFCVTKNSLCLIKKKLNMYFCALYKKHIRDDLFSKGTIRQMSFVKKTRAVLNENEKDYKYANSLSQGEKKEFYNKQYIISDLSRCYPYPFSITTDNIRKHKQPFHNLISFTAIKDIPCRINEKKHHHSAVYVLSDGRDNGFTFSFCPNHLHQFGKVLLYYFKNPTVTEYSLGDFCIEKSNSINAYCYLLHQKNKTMYRLHLNECRVVLCKDAIDLITDEVLTSSVFSELFPLEAIQYKKLKEISDTNEIKRLNEEFSKEREIFQEENKSISKYYENIIIDKNQKAENIRQNYENIIKEKKQALKKSAEKIKELKLQNLKLKFKIDHIEQIAEDMRNKKEEYYKGRILNCNQNINTINLGVSQKSAQNNIVDEFKVTFAYGLECSTFNHSSSSKAVAIIETGREDTFCFSLCEDCINTILYGIKKTYTEKFYINNRNDFSIIVLKEKEKAHCYNCGKSNERMRAFSLGCYRFILCDEHTQKFENQLIRIKQELHKINTEKRIYFIEQ